MSVLRIRSLFIYIPPLRWVRFFYNLIVAYNDNHCQLDFIAMKSFIPKEERALKKNPLFRGSGLKKASCMEAA